MNEIYFKNYSSRKPYYQDQYILIVCFLPILSLPML